jgi:hypothetical protein
MDTGWMKGRKAAEKNKNKNDVYVSDRRPYINSRVGSYGWAVQAKKENHLQAKPN